jgi:HAD superfamily hydrolase (TIGR01509 family)
MGKYEAVIFDLGGTLIYQSTWQEQDQYIRQMAKVLGVPNDDFLRVWRETYEDRTKGTFGSVQNDIKHICEHLGVPVVDSRIEAAASIPLEITKRMVMAPRDDALPVLAHLKRLRYKTGLVSNWSSHLSEVWNDSALARLIDVAVISSAVGLMKPDLRIFQLVAERLKVAPGRCLYVADGYEEELATASEVGMSAVMLRFSDASDELPNREKWQVPVISSLEEVLLLSG